MSPRPILNVPASVHQRLINRAREVKRPFNELLQYYSMERFLYRLSRSAHGDKFILKGALMLVAWEAPLARPTMDIDLLGTLKNDPETVGRVVGEICRTAVPEDGVTFDPESVVTDRIREDADYPGVRARVKGHLGNARLRIQVDVGFGDVVVPKAAAVSYPTLLGFPAPKLRGYTRESAVAEKFEAMTKLGMLNSRLKDYHDVWLLSRTCDFDGETLARALRRTFETRGTPIDPKTVSLSGEFAADPAKNTQWSAFLRRNRLRDVPDDLAEIVGCAAAFLLPPALAVAGGMKFPSAWNAPGPWSSR